MAYGPLFAKILISQARKKQTGTQTYQVGDDVFRVTSGEVDLCHGGGQQDEDGRLAGAVEAMHDDRVSENSLLAVVAQHRRRQRHQVVQQVGRRLKTVCTKMTTTLRGKD